MWCWRELVWPRWAEDVEEGLRKVGALPCSGRLESALGTEQGPRWTLPCEGHTGLSPHSTILMASPSH